MAPNTEPPAGATEANLRAHIKHLNKNASIQAGTHGPQVEVLDKGICYKAYLTMLHIVVKVFHEIFCKTRCH